MMSMGNGNDTSKIQIAIEKIGTLKSFPEVQSRFDYFPRQ